VKPETLAAKSLHPVDASTGAIVPPIQLATTYARDAGYALVDGRDYTRDKNPTVIPAEDLLSALEGGAGARLFASGMAAATAAIRAHIKPGDHVVAPRVCYFALRNWLTRFGAQWGVDVTLVDMTNRDEPRAACGPGPRLVGIGTPANPTWAVTDIAGAAEIAHAAGARLAVDSTCATPVHTHPLALGADLVMHSATKYLGGHSDVLAGALVTRALDAPWDSIGQLRHDEGALLGPVEAWLLLRGMRTLFARVERQSRTAMGLAQRLEGAGVVVSYRGLPWNPKTEFGGGQMTGGFGGMLSIFVPGDPLAVVRRMKVWIPATSLGGVESLVEHRATVEGPTSPTPPDLLRLSVGLEHEDDLFDDLIEAVRG